MANACVGECGLIVVDGVLEIDWASIGTAYATTQSAGFIIETVIPSIDYGGPQGVQRLAYTNTTCHTQLVEYRAHSPSIEMTMGDGNTWSAILYWTHAFGAPPNPNTFDLTNIATLRANHASGAPGTNAITAPLPGRDMFVEVPPGQTLHMMASMWRMLDQVTSDPSNRLAVSGVALQYRRTPLAA